MIALVCPYTFDAAHRLTGEHGPEQQLHGHTFTARIHLCGDVFPDSGALDPGNRAGTAIGDWIAAHLDRVTILHPADPLVGVLAGHTQVHRLPTGRHPTGEHLAAYLAVGATAALVAVGLHRDLQVVRIDLHSTHHAVVWTA